jgi:hypothetical protein
VRLQLDPQASARLDADYLGTILALYEDCASVHLRTEALSREPITISLNQVQYAPVVVTQSDGAPAKGVALTVDTNNQTLAPLQVKTGDDGSARVPLLQIGSDGNGTLVLRALVATERPLLQRLREVPSKPVPWQLPACGSVHVTVKGIPDGVRAQVLLTRTSPRDANGFRPSSTEANDVPSQPQSWDGTTARFDYVEPGKQMNASVLLDGMPDPIPFPVGDVIAGKQTDVLADLDAGPPRIAVRVLDGNGKPLADTPLQCLVERPTRPRFWICSDSEGRIQLAIGWPNAGETPLTIHHMATLAGSAEVADSVQVPLTGLKPGHNDVGDVRLLPLPLALEGRCVDADNQGVAGVRFYTNQGQVLFCSTKSDASGKFVLRMPEPHPPQLKLQKIYGSEFLFADAPLETKVDLEPGTKSCVIPIQRAGRVSVGLFPRIPDLSNDLSFEFTDPDNKDYKYSARLAKDTTWLSVPPGRWKVRLRLYQQEVFAIDELNVEAGIENHEPRLMRLVWSDFAHRACIRITEPSGAPAENCTVMVYSDNGRAGSGSLARGGVMNLLLPKEGTTVQVQPRDPGFVPVDLGAIDGDRNVQLKPALRVAISWQAPLQLGEEVSLVMSQDTRAGILSEAVFGPDGKALLFAAKPGKLDLRFALRKGNTTHYLNSRISVEVDDQASPKTLEMTDALRTEVERRLGQIRGG